MKPSGASFTAATWQRAAKGVDHKAHEGMKIGASADKAAMRHKSTIYVLGLLTLEWALHEKPSWSLMTSEPRC